MLGHDPDPVLLALSRRMIREAPLRFLVSMSGGEGSVKAFEGLPNSSAPCVSPAVARSAALVVLGGDATDLVDR